MTQASRVRRRRPAGPLPLAAAGAVVALCVVAFVALLVVPEIRHRTDSSWHYERVTLRNCVVVSRDVHATGYYCAFATTPPLPFATETDVNIDGNAHHAPSSTTEWVHVVNGRIAGATGTKVSLWVLALLLIPVLLLAGLVRSVRTAHRAGRRWRDPRGH